MQDRAGAGAGAAASRRLGACWPGLAEARGSWCDVRLRCRGSEFQAHRAVLSSVSPFLRIVLLAHTEEDSSTIVLPEFEVEAMSSVLYYVYNGEVCLPVEKLHSFFEIVKALQICVDKSALHAMKDKIEDFDTKILDISSYDEVFQKLMKARSIALNNALKKHDIVKDESENRDLERIIIGDLITKRNAVQNGEIRGLRKDFSSLRAQKGVALASSASNLPQRDRDQRKNSPIRDLRTEVRPGSGHGHANGTADCVRTIANEDNLLATSAYVTNETVSRPRLVADDVDASRIPRMTPSDGFSAGHRPAAAEAFYPYTFDVAANVHQAQRSSNNELITPHINKTNHSYPFPVFPLSSTVTRNCDDELRLWKDVFSLSRLQNNFRSRPQVVQKPHVLRPVPTLLPLARCQDPNLERKLRPPPPLLDLSPNLRLMTPSPERNTLQSMIRSSNLTNCFTAVSAVTDGNTSQNSLSDRGQDLFDLDKTDKAKKTAYNQVLASPWSAKSPICYRPAPPVNTTIEKEVPPAAQEEEERAATNDSNNNVRSADVARAGTDKAKVPSTVKHTPHSIAAIIGAEPQAPALTCTVCEKVFTSEETLSAHGRTHAAGARHSCQECGKSFSQLRNYKYHLSVHRGTREFAATCTVCGKYFNDRGYLSSHMKIHRNRKEYECPHCPKSFNQRVAYNMHVRIHTGVKPHVCGECGKAFSRKMLLKQHQRTHSGERPYACAVCEKRFADRSNMTLHMRLHSGVKPFACSLCPKSFTKKHHLKTHLNYHTGDKPYSCPRCQLAFSQSSNMRTHLKKCTAPSPTAPPAPPSPPAQAAT